jgi:hypothetical protein
MSDRKSEPGGVTRLTRDFEFNSYEEAVEFAVNAIIADEGGDGCLDYRGVPAAEVVEELEYEAKWANDLAILDAMWRYYERANPDGPRLLLPRLARRLGRGGATVARHSGGRVVRPKTTTNERSE